MNSFVFFFSFFTVYLFSFIHCLFIYIYYIFVIFFIFIRLLFFQHEPSVLECLWPPSLVCLPSSTRTRRTMAGSSSRESLTELAPLTTLAMTSPSKSHTSKRGFIFVAGCNYEPEAVSGAALCCFSEIRMH